MKYSHYFRWGRVRPCGQLVRYGEGYRPRQGVRISYSNAWPMFFLLLFNVVIGQYKFYIGLVSR